MVEHRDERTPPVLRRGLSTANVLVTDRVGSTLTLVRHGADAADAERHRHDALVAEVVAVFGGEVVKSTGDGALAVLPSADALVRAGWAVQEAASACGLPLRIGMSTGDVVVEDRDMFGEAVVVASRLCDACPGGQVLVDGTTVAVRGKRRDPAVTPRSRITPRGFDEPRTLWAVVPPPPPTTRLPPAEPAIGRDAELARITSAWDPTRSTLVLVTGEPGIGKTHLARAAASGGRPPIWVRFAASQRDGFAAWCAAIDEAAQTVPAGRIAALGRSVVTRAAALLPSVAVRLPITADDGAAEAARDLTFDALAHVVELVGLERTIVLDDAHWSGATSLAFTTRLLGSTAGLRLLATSRLPAPRELHDAATLVLPLHGLSDAALAELLAGRGVATTDLSAITRRADGNPLLALVASDGSPGGHGDPVAEAFLALPPDELEVLGIAGMLGRHVDVLLLQHLTGRPPPELASLLHAAVVAGLLAGDDRLSFVHDLVREAAEAAVPLHRRIALHAAAATELSRRGDARAAIHHVLHGFPALDADDAVEMLAAGCEVLAERLAFEDMLDVAVRMREVVVGDGRGRPRHEAAALLLQSWAHELLGNLAEHKRTALQAGRIARACGADMLLVEAALSRAGYGMAGLADPDTADLLDAALAVVGDDGARRARLTAMRAFYLVNYEGRGAEAREAAAAAVVIAREVGDVEALAEVVANRLFVLLSTSDVVEQTALAEELEHLAAQLPPARRRLAIGTLHRNVGPLRLQLGDREGFDAAHEGLRASATESQSWLLSAIAEMWDGLVALLDGRPDEAERVAGHLLGQPDEHNFRASGSGMLAAAHRWRGTLDDAVEPLVRIADSQPGLPIGASLSAIALALVGDGRAGSVIDRLLASTPVVVDDSTVAGQLAALVEACALTGREVPGDVADALLPYRGQVLVLSWGVDVAGAADRFLAVVDACAGRATAAAAAFDRAAALEARVSPALTARTAVWRHVLLGDDLPDVPPTLGGLLVEAEVLRAATTGR